MRRVRCPTRTLGHHGCGQADYRAGEAEGALNDHPPVLHPNSLLLRVRVRVRPDLVADENHSTSTTALPATTAEEVGELRRELPGKRSGVRSGALLTGRRRTGPEDWPVACRSLP
jgi:hypothetical protein